MNKKSPPSIAFVYDRVNTPHGGAERVLTALHELYPEAPLFTSLYDKSMAKWASSFTVKTSFLQNIPGIKKLHRQFLAVMPFAFSQLDLTQYDIVISITSAEAKAIKVSSSSIHICYLLTPPRYVWSHPYEYQSGILKPLKIALTHFLRKWDFWVSQKPDSIIPISALVKQRALKYYRRTISKPIPPTISFLDFLQSSNDYFKIPPDREYFLIVSRLVSYKRIDIAIQACLKLRKKLVIIGQGPDENRLKSLANSDKNVQFIREVTDTQLKEYYSKAKGFLMPAEEDFGITLHEAQRCGTPFIAYRHVGALDTATLNKSGLIFLRQDPETLVKTIQEFELKRWDRSYIQKQAEKFTKRSFQQEFKDNLEKLWYSHTIED